MIAALTTFLAVAVAVHVLSLVLTAAKLMRRRPVAGAVPPTTVLRPVSGTEHGLYDTLGSGFRLDPPARRQVFCAHRADDPAVAVVERLIAAHPAAAAELLVGDDRISVNPKLNNLVKGWHAARDHWIVMADSNVLMPPEYLAELFACWDGRTGLVCSPPVGSAPASLAAEVECALLNTYQARWQLVADVLGFGFAQGKTMLWRREVLEAAGGIERLALEVAEDAASTKIVRAAGLKVRLVDRPFPQPLGPRTWREVWRRQVRWARLRRASFPLAFAPEAIAGGLPPLAAATALAAAGALPGAAPVVLAALWYGAEWCLARAAGWPAGARQIPAMILRDLALPVLFVAAIAGNGFVWRGNAMAVAPALRRPAATGEARP